MKVKVKSVFFEKEVVNLMYGSALGMGNLTGDERRANTRLINSFENHAKFDPEVDKGQCPECGNQRIHFELKEGEKGLYIPIRREDRMPLYDLFVKKTMDRKPAKNLERKLRDVAEALGYLKSFNDLEAIQKDAEALNEEDVEFETVDSWEDEEENAGDPKDSSDSKPSPE